MTDVANFTRARLFVALDLPIRMRDALAAWQAEVIPADPALRAVPAKQLHMTLVFLGRQMERDIEAIAAVVLDVDRAALNAVGLRPAAEISVTPSASRPRLLAATFTDVGALTELRTQLASDLAVAGFYQDEKRPFWPHVTVARVRQARRGGRRAGELKQPWPPIAGLPRSLPPAGLTLYRSDPLPAGASYTKLLTVEADRSD